VQLGAQRLQARGGDRLAAVTGLLAAHGAGTVAGSG
jgi:hypothetical protein